MKFNNNAVTAAEREYIMTYRAETVLDRAAGAARAGGVADAASWHSGGGIFCVVGTAADDVRLVIGSGYGGGGLDDDWEPADGFYVALETVDGDLLREGTVAVGSASDVAAFDVLRRTVEGFVSEVQ